MMDALPDDQVELLDAGHCPDCDHRGFVLGPRGGNSINIECGNIGCRARFNVTTERLAHHIVWAQRIPRESEGGPSWGKSR